MPDISSRQLLCIGIALLVAGGCEVGPDYHPPQINVMDDWGEQGREPTTRPTTLATTLPSRTITRPIPLVEWWTTFHDPTLDGLITQAVGANLDLKMAEERVREARGVRAAVRSDLFPKIDASGSYEHARPSQNGLISAFGAGGGGQGATVGGGGASAPGAGGSPAIPGAALGSEFDLYQAGFDASWEIDIFGGKRRAVEAATADVQAAIESHRAVLLTVLGEVARDYVELRSLQQRLAIARENLEVQKHQLELTRQMHESGLTNQLDVSRQAAQVATTASVIPALESSLGQTIHQLSILLNERPTTLADSFNKSAPLPTVPDEVPIGLPSELLLRRPDIRRAERQLAAATARIGAAQSDYFPKFNLTGSIGLQSMEPGQLLDYASRYYAIGPQVTWPIFNAGQTRGRVEIAKAQAEQARLTLQQTVLSALKDVEDALITYAKAQQRTASLAEAVEANRTSVRVSQELYARGLADFLSVLDAQRSLFLSEDALATSRGEVATTLVSLYKSLGGGWELSGAR